MIAEELLKIKSFGSDRKSAVTEGDIAQKEAELGFPLPAALRELYLCFHPDDPVFSLRKLQCGASPVRLKNHKGRQAEFPGRESGSVPLGGGAEQSFSIPPRQ